MKQDDFTPAFLRAVAALESMQNRMEELLAKQALMKLKIEHRTKFIKDKFAPEYERYVKSKK